METASPSRLVKQLRQKREDKHKLRHANATNSSDKRKENMNEVDILWKHVLKVTDKRDIMILEELPLQQQQQTFHNRQQQELVPLLMSNDNQNIDDTPLSPDDVFLITCSSALSLRVNNNHNVKRAFASSCSCSHSVVRQSVSGLEAAVAVPKGVCFQLMRPPRHPEEESRGRSASSFAIPTSASRSSNCQRGASPSPPPHISSKKQDSCSPGKKHTHISVSSCGGKLKTNRARNIAHIAAATAAGSAMGKGLTWELLKEERAKKQQKVRERREENLRVMNSDKLEKMTHWRERVKCNERVEVHKKLCVLVACLRLPAQLLQVVQAGSDAQTDAAQKHRTMRVGALQSRFVSVMRNKLEMIQGLLRLKMRLFAKRRAVKLLALFLHNVSTALFMVIQLPRLPRVLHLFTCLVMM